MEETPPADLCAIAVMAKAPQAGRTKTRLVPPLDPAEAAALGAAFLRDITESIARAGRDAPVAGYVAYAPAGQEARFDGALASGTRLLLADGSPPMPPRVQGFGRSLLHATQAAFAAGHGAVCLLNADSPTLPTEFLCRAARALLAPGDRVVLGPAEDGGYYLIGTKAPHAHLFEDIDWSTERVAAQTRERVSALGMELVELPAWYDVDDPAALARLVADLGLLCVTPPPGPLPQGEGEKNMRPASYFSPPLGGGAGGGVTQAPYPAPATTSCLQRRTALLAAAG